MNLHDLLFSEEYHFQRYYFFAVLMLVPMARIFRRAGFSPYWAGLLVIPEINLLVCALVLAARKWTHREAA